MGSLNLFPPQESLVHMPTLEPLAEHCCLFSTATSTVKQELHLSQLPYVDPDASKAAAALFQNGACPIPARQKALFWGNAGTGEWESIISLHFHWVCR